MRLSIKTARKMMEAGRRQHVRYFAVGGVSVMQYEEEKS